MAGVSIGYARGSTDSQDLDANRQVLLGGVLPADQLSLDRASCDTVLTRPVLDQVRAGVNAGATA